MLLTVIHPNGTTSQITERQAAASRAWETNETLSRSQGMPAAIAYATRLAESHDMPVVVWSDMRHDLFHLNGVLPF